MFTRAEAIDFAFERGLKGANFVYWDGEKIVIYYWEGRSTDLTYSSGPSAIDSQGDRHIEALRSRTPGWFVSAKVNKVWAWHFSNGDVVPHRD